MKIEGITVKWQKSNFRGVRFYEHPTRKNGRVKKDRYFSIRYQVDGKRTEQGLGWSTDPEGWTEEKAALTLKKYKHAAQNLKGPKTRTEEREARKAELAQEEARRLQEEKENITFKQASSKFLEWAKANKGDWQHDETRLRVHVLPLFGEMQMNSITPAHVEQMKTSCTEKGLALATVRHVLQIVRAVYNHAERMDIYSGPIPTKKISFPKPNNRRNRFFSYEQADKLLKELDARGYHDLHDISLMAFETGMRFSEIAKLTWENVDLPNLIIHVNDSKSGESGDVYINQKLREMLLMRQASNSSGLVFPSRNGKVREDAPRTFAKTVDDLGFNDGVTDSRNKLTFHSTRHTFGSWLALQGTPLLTIKELMRHKVVEMTLRYAHLIPDHKREAVEKLGKRNAAKVVSIEEARKKKAV